MDPEQVQDDDAINAAFRQNRATCPLPSLADILQHIGIETRTRPCSSEIVSSSQLFSWRLICSRLSPRNCRARSGQFDALRRTDTLRIRLS